MYMHTYKYVIKQTLRNVLILGCEELLEADNTIYEVIYLIFIHDMGFFAGTFKQILFGNYVHTCQTYTTNVDLEFLDLNKWLVQRWKNLRE